MVYESICESHSLDVKLTLILGVSGHLKIMKFPFILAFKISFDTSSPSSIITITLPDHDQDDCAGENFYQISIRKDNIKQLIILCLRINNMIKHPMRLLLLLHP